LRVKGLAACYLGAHDRRDFGAKQLDGMQHLAMFDWAKT
jgi:hypothetical protein